MNNPNHHLYRDQVMFFHRQPPRAKPTPRGMETIERPEHYDCYSFHYSNPHSQNALICETFGFPDWYNPKTQVYTSAYSDRIQGWGAARMEHACEIAGTGDQGWGYALPRLSHDRLREFGRVALGLPCIPTHVRVIHYYNVSNGYSCPVVVAVYPKT